MVSFTKKYARKIFRIFDQNHRLTPLEKCKFFNYSEMTVLSYKKRPFLKTTSSNDRTKVSFAKKYARKISEIFDQNHGLTSLDNCKFSGYSKMTFFIV